MEPEDQNQGDSFFKESEEKIKSVGEKAKKTKKAFKIFMKLPTTVKIAIIAIPLGIILLMLLFAGGVYLLDILGFENIFNAKTSAMGAGTAYSTKVVKMENGKWTLNLDDEIKTELENAGIKTDGMTQEELLIEYLKLKGLSEEDLTKDEISILPYLIKAEIATQQLDLRKAKDMYKNDGTYNVPDIKDMKKSNEICGTIHLKRVNTADLDNPILLEYIDYETFKQAIKKENPTQNDYKSIKGYFSINDEGNAVIATWNYNKTTYKLEDEKIKNPYKGTNTFQDSENYTLSEMVVDYKPLVNKYTLPFEVLTALLVNSEDTEFVEKVANLAFSANIEVTIAEEMTETKKTYVTNYYETIRNYQYISMYAPVNGNRTQITNYEFLHGDSSCDNEDDEIVDFHRLSIKGTELEDPENQFDCTYKDINFDENTPSYIVKQHVVLKDNTYKYGVTYADTWFMKATKNISQKPTTENLEEQGSKVEDTYKYSETKSSKRANIPEDIEKNYLEDYYNKNKQRIEEKARQKTEQQANSQVATQPHPIVSIVLGNPNTIKIEYNQQINQIIDGNGRRFYGTSTKNPSTGFTIITVSGITSSSLTLVDSGRNTFSYVKNAAGVWEFKGSTPAIDVDYDQKTIRYKRTDTQSSIASGSIKTKYELVEGTPTQTIYDKKDEKFLKAYDESSKAKGNMSSTPGWLEEMIDEYDPNFSTIIMYLLDSYYGRDTSEYDINSVLDIYGLESFKQFSGTSGAAAGFNQFKRWLRLEEGHQGISSDGTQYKVGLVGGNRTVGYGIDLETSRKRGKNKAISKCK